MYEENQPNKLLNLVLAGLAVLTLGLAGYLIFSWMSSRPNTQISKPFAQNINFPAKADESHLVFYTGHGFALLDTTSHQTSQLGATRILPTTPTSVQWAKNGAFIRAANYTIFDDLGSKIAPKYLGSVQKPSYLWYVPFTGNPVVVDEFVESTFADTVNSTVYYTTRSDEGYTISMFDANTNTSKVIVEGQGTAVPRVVYGSQGIAYALVQSGDRATQLIRYGKSGSPEVIQENILGTGGQGAGENTAFVMPSDAYAVFVRPNNKTSELVTYSLSTRKTKVLVKDFSGTINISGEQVFANGHNGDNLVFTRIDGPTSTQRYIASQAGGSISNTFGFATNLITVNQLAQAMTVSKQSGDTKNLPEIKSTGLEKIIDKQHLGKQYDLSIDLTNAATGNTYIANIYPDYVKNSTLLMDDIKAAGYDPNQLVINFNYTVQRQ